MDLMKGRHLKQVVNQGNLGSSMVPRVIRLDKGCMPRAKKVSHLERDHGHELVLNGASIPT